MATIKQAFGSVLSAVSFSFSAVARVAESVDVAAEAAVAQAQLMKFHSVKAVLDSLELEYESMEEGLAIYEELCKSLNGVAEPLIKPVKKVPYKAPTVAPTAP